MQLGLNLDILLSPAVRLFNAVPFFNILSWTYSLVFYYLLYLQHRNTVKFLVSIFWVCLWTTPRDAGFCIPSGARRLICILWGLLFIIIDYEGIYAVIYISLDNSCFLWGESPPEGRSSHPGSSLPQHSPNPNYTPQGSEEDYLSTVSANNSTKDDFQDEQIRNCSDQIRYGNREDRLKFLAILNNIALHEVRPDRIDGVIDRLTHLSDYKGMPEFCRKDIIELISKCYGMRRPGR